MAIERCQKMYLHIPSEFQTAEDIKKQIVRDLSVLPHPENLAEDIEIKSIDRYYIPLYRFIIKVTLLLPNVGPKECKFDFVIPAISDKSGMKINNHDSRYFMEIMNDKYQFKDLFIDSCEIKEAGLQSICVQPDIVSDGSYIKQCISNSIDRLCQKIIYKIKDKSDDIFPCDYTIEESKCDGVIYYLPQIDIKYIYKDTIYNAYLNVTHDSTYIFLDFITPRKTEFFIEAEKEYKKRQDELFADIKKEQDLRRKESLAKDKKERLMHREEETRKQNERALKNEITNVEQYNPNSCRWIIGSIVVLLIIWSIAQFIFEPSRNKNIIHGTTAAIGLGIMISEGLNIILLNFGNDCKKKWKYCKDFIDETLTKRYGKVRKKIVNQTFISFILFIIGLIVLIVGQNS